MFRINANDYACVIISQYLGALQSNNFVVVTHAYSYQFQLPAGSSTRNETPYIPLRENIEHRFLPLIIMCGLGQVLSAPVVNSKCNLVWWFLPKLILWGWACVCVVFDLHTNYTGKYTRALLRGHSLSQHTQFLKNNMIAENDFYLWNFDTISRTNTLATCSLRSCAFCALL